MRETKPSFHTWRKVGAVGFAGSDVPVPRDRTKSGCSRLGHIERDSQRPKRTGLFRRIPPSWKLPMFGMAIDLKNLREVSHILCARSTGPTLVQRRLHDPYN